MRRAAGVLVAWAISCLPLFAQIGSGRLVGVVSDTSGAPLPGATVTVTAVAINQSRGVTTGPDGSYSMTGLLPGVYDVRVDLHGFTSAQREGVRVAIGESLRVDTRLGVGAVREVVVVRADPPLLRRETASLGHVVDEEKIANLPLNGRTFITLAGLVPGVALPPNSFFPRINGGRPRTNEYLYDGISVLQPEPGQVAFFPIIDAIQEFKIETNSPPAEFGRFNGGVVNLTTKSGTNQFHGTAFEFFRDDALNARNVFAAADPGKPQYVRSQFGAVAGGPVVRDRTFFFADYQGQRQTIARTVISTVPTPLQRQGVFTEAIGGRVPQIFDPASGTSNRTPFANNTVPGARWDPVARALLNRFPLPTSTGTANNYRRTAEETVNQDQFDVRLDHKIAGSDSVFARATGFRESFLPVTPLPEGSGATSGTLGPQDTRSWSFASRHQRSFSASVLNEIRLGDTRRQVERRAVELSGTASSLLGLPGIPSTARFPNTLPTIGFSNAFQQLGSPANTASDFSTSVTQIADSFTWIEGRHSLKFGGDLRWERLDVIQPPSPTGTFTFSALFTDQPGVTNTGNALASFLLGQVQAFSIDLQRDEIRNRASFQEYFAQDDWRVHDRLTVNAGLRYTLNFPSTEERNQVGIFNLDTRQMEYAGENGIPRAARRLHKDNFGPRLGVAASVADRTVVRAGYGLVWIEMAGITTPFTTPVFPFLQTVTERTLDNLTPAFVLENGPSVAAIGLTPDAGLGQGVFSVDRELGSGYVQQWNVSVQRELAANIAVEAAYVGSRITHVGIPDTNLNQLTVEQLALGTALTERVPNPYYGIIPRSSSLGDPTIPYGQLLKPYPQYTTVSLYRNNVGTTAYDGVSLKFEQRMSHGLSYLVSYTRSKLMDDASSVFDASILTGPVANSPVADSFNRALERDYSTGDIPHVFAASAVWQLPFRSSRLMGAVVRGWSLSGILTLQSGVPIAVTQSTNNNAFAGFGAQRPNIAGDPELPSDERTVARWFNTGAFSTAPAFTLGNASRNPVRGPGYRNLDLALARRVAIRRGIGLELRAEAFNIANTPPLGAPNGSFGTAAFGTITSAGDPRVIQLAAKLLF